MVKISRLLYRAVLVLGVLVALTPCGFCQKGPAGDQAASHCSMGGKKGHGCCHKGSRDPLCKVMDQSSVPAPSIHVPAPLLSPGPAPAFSALDVRTWSGPSFIPVSSPSPPGLLPLRI